MDTLWIVLGIVLLAIIALAVVTIRKARREEAAAKAGLMLDDEDDEGRPATRHTELYTLEWAQRDAYNDIKQKQTSGPAPTADSEEEKTAKKLAAKALLERTMQAVENAWKFQKDAPEMSSSRQAGYMPDKVWESFNKAQLDLNNELEEIKKEAEAVKEGDGEKIIKNAVEILHAQKRKEMRKEMEKKAVKEKIKAERKAAKAAEHTARSTADEEKRKAVAAEKAFELLMAEEDRAAKKGSKGKRNGSTKGKATLSPKATPSSASSSSSSSSSSPLTTDVVEEDDSLNTSVDDIDLSSLATSTTAAAAKKEANDGPARRRKK